jgi:polysaccharide biosynthesis transport protein
MTSEGQTPRDVERHALDAYLEAVLRRPASVVIPTALVLAVAVAAGLLLPKRYRASVLIGVEPAALSGAPAPGRDTGASDRWLQAAAVRMLSRSRLVRVAEETNALPGSAGEAAGERLRAAMGFRPVGADSLRVECVLGDPATAALVANRVAALFVEETENERQSRGGQSPEQIEARLAAARQAMEEKETAIRRFQEQADGRSSAPAPATQAPLQQLQVERQAVTGQLVAAQGQVEILRRALEPNSGRPPGGAGGPAVELEQLRARLADMRKRYTDRYPDVQTVLRRIQELEAVVRATPEPGPGVPASQAELEKAEGEVETLEQRLTNIDVEIARLRTLAARPPGAAEERAALAHDYDQAQESYLALLKEWTDARAAQPLGGNASAARFRILEPARIPERPFFPSLGGFALAGLVAGLALGVLLACTREFLDHSVKGPEDLEDLLPQPLLATIPHVDVPDGNRQK